MIFLIFPLLAVISSYQFDVSHNGDWKISGDEGAVLDSGHYMLCQNGECYNTINGELEIVPLQMHRYGEDVIGAYDESVFVMLAPPKGVEAHVYMRNYIELETVVFGQHFWPTYPNMSMFDRDRVSTSFPSIKVPQTSDAYYINPCGYHTGWTDLRKGSWDQKNMTDMCGGLEGGPFFVFDQANYTREYAGQFFAISSFSNFMVHNTQVTQNEYYNELWFGLMGSVNEVPENGFSLETIISYSNKGFTAGMEKWGSTLRKRYGKTLEKRNSDMTANYLSYWTDNGAFYYYHTDQDNNYGDQLQKIAKQDIPFQSWNYDSWWYYKDGGDHGGVVNWTAMPEVFPNGMDATFDKTHLPVTAHNRWWSDLTTYAKQNGGKYDFIIKKESSGTAVPETALPTSIEFWRDLFKNSTSWGLKVYEQDWLNEQTMKLEELTTSATLGRDWLMQMGQAAEENGINILYCMAMPRHMLQSLEIPAVTIIRVSDDYHPGNRQWDIGISSIYSNALGLAPFKDVFWTTEHQPGNPRYDDKYEFRTYLQTIVAALSTGPVGIGDQIGKTDMKLLNRTMMPDGRILSPSYPASIPDMLIWTLDTKLYLNGTTEWYTYSQIGETNQTLFELTMAFAESTPPFISHKPAHHASKNYMAVSHTGEFSYFKAGLGDEMKYRNVGNYTELVVIFSGSPIWKMGIPPNLSHEVSLFGETTSKMTSVSPVRFPRMDVDTSHVYIDMNGVEGELIILEWLIDEKPTQLNCTVPASGKVSANVALTTDDKLSLFCEDI